MRRIHDIILYKATAIVMTAVAILLTLSMPTSCCRHNRVVDEDDMPITLRVSSTDTKAAVNSLADMVNQCFTLSGGTYTLTQGAGFGVYGFKYMSGSQPLTLFRNQLVQPGNTVEETQEGVTDANWSYTPLKYWDSNPTVYYHFMAYWPYLTDEEPQDNSPYVSISNIRDVTIHNIPYWQPGSTGDDFMFSNARIGQYNAAQNNPAIFSDGTVRFTFEHILSKIVIEAYYVGELDNKVTITDLTLRGIGFLGKESNNLKTYTKPISSETPEGFTPSSTETVKDNTPIELFHDDNGIELRESAFKDENDENSQARPDTICTWLIVPSDGWGTENNLNLGVSYQISDGATPGPAQSSNISNLSFDSGVGHEGETLSGHAYTIILKFNTAGGGVILQEVYIKDWEDAAPINEGVFNW